MIEKREVSKSLSNKEKIEQLLTQLGGGIEKGPLFDSLGDFNRIVICGSSLSGKSTIASMFRNHKYDGDKFDTVHRYTTRPSRKGKNQSAENSNIDNDFFDNLKEKEHIIYWERAMEKKGNDQRSVMYGFHSDEIVQTFREMNGKNKNNKTTYVYSANNDFVRRMQDNTNSNVKQLEKKTLVLYVDAPEGIRKERMQNREDNMLTNRPEEAKYRLSDDGEDVKAKSHLIVKNFGKNENQTADNVEKFIQTLFS